MAMHMQKTVLRRYKKTEVSGTFQDRFVATSFKLLPEEKKIEQK
jgi:hypothetical protein